MTDESTTPVDSPPPGPGLPGLPENGKPPAPEAPNAIMEALANIARQNVSAAPSNQGMPSFAPQTTPAPSQSTAMSQPLPQYPSSAPPPVSVPGMPFPFPQLPQAHAQQPPMAPTGLPGGYAGAPSAPPAAGADGQMQSVMLIKLLVDQGVPPDKIPAIVASLSGMQGSGAPSAGSPAIPQSGQMPYASGWGGQDGYRAPAAHESAGFDQMRSPNRYRNRSRSRSPPRQWNSPGSRGDRDFGAYGHNVPGGRHMDDRDRRDRAQDYRQRSPPGRRDRSRSQEQYSSEAAKWVDYDRSLPSGSIKVLSRTLFVGGVTCSEPELRDIFSRHGEVQTCIVNKDKRHAFVKMLTRRDAVAAKDAMEGGPFRTRWGVGFGPRDCSDYATGISVIPINKLTEADRKWMLTAPFGGSGGRPIETGIVVEEPDIEIGAGVSSKAISRRMQTDKSGRHGPKSTRGGGGSDDNNEPKWKRQRESNQKEERRGPPGPNDGDEPSISGFPFGIGTGPNGMPVFPAGFAFPAPPDNRHM